MRFSGPFSVRWPRRVLSSERPAHRTLPLRRYPATPAPFGTNRVAKLAPAGLRSPSSECEVEVLGVADERGWASRPDRIQRGVRSSGRRPVAGSRRRDDRAVRGRPGNPVPSHSRPTQPHASAAASHPPPTPGHAPPRLVARCSATRIRRPCNARPGRTSWVLPSARPTALLGFRSIRPSQVCSRRRVVRHVSVRPGPRVVRAPVIRPIDFRRVAGCSRVSDPSEARRPGMRWRRLPGFAPVCGPPPSLAATVRSCHGLCLFQGWRALLFVHPNGHVPARITSLRG